MKSINARKQLSLPVFIFLSLLLSACSNNDNDDMNTMPPAPEPEVSFNVEVTNLTANQPMSPITLLGVGSDYHPWQNGEPANLALETLAESGDNSLYDTSVTGINQVTATIAILMPGETIRLTLSQKPTEVAGLSLLTMLVNSNDAFTGINNANLQQMTVNEQQTFYTATYDAGTEANSEMKGSIPGPADGGEGFNANRDDVNRVHLHPGIISQDDRLSDSVLNASHRFDNPTLKIRVTRTQ